MSSYEYVGREDIGTGGMRRSKAFYGWLAVLAIVVLVAVSSSSTRLQPDGDER